MAEQNTIYKQYPLHGGYYEIRVRGHLDPCWSEWFEGMVLRLTDKGDTLLSGYIQDQAGLQSILNKIYRLNLLLLSVNLSESENNSPSDLLKM